MTFVPLRLRQHIELHLLRNLAADSLGHAPLILGIEGEPGTGKTRAVDEVARMAGIQILLISGDQLESPNAGYPAQLIRTTYRQAGKKIEEGSGAVLVVNDIDVAIGDWGGSVQYTMNRQMVTEAFMHLCDFPKRVDSYNTPRVPIIFTGNNFSLLHGPLMRSGRFDYMYWEPTLQEKILMIEGVLGPEHRKLAELLVKTYPHEPISFFQDCIAAARNDTLRALLHRNTLRTLLERVQQGKRPRITPPTSEQILTSAENLIRNRQSQKDSS